MCFYVLYCRRCPSKYVCVKGAGENPKYGFISYDNFYIAMLTSLQVCTLDYWESVYNSVSINWLKTIALNMAARNLLARCTAFFHRIPIESLKICNFEIASRHSPRYRNSNNNNNNNNDIFYFCSIWLLKRPSVYQ